MTLFLELLAVAVLILLNGFFVAAEYGLVTARRTRILELHHQGNRRARDVLRITGNPPRFIAAMQLGVTLTSLGIGALGEHALAKLLDPIVATAVAIGLAYLILTFFHVVIGELVPKGMALGHPEGTALSVAVPVRAFFTVAQPLIWVLMRSTELVLRLFGLEPPGADNEVHSEVELRILLSRSTEQGEIEREEQQMIDKVFDFADKDAADVMVPRPDVVAVSIDLPTDEAVRVLLESPYTRYPVYRGSLDKIIGTLHVRDLYVAMYERGIEQTRLEDLVRPPFIVPETKDLATLLAEFRRTNQHMAIVVDEYGALGGIVTLEDLLEEIVGEIEDEFDVPEEPIEHVDDDTIRVDGTFPIEEFNDRFHAELPGEDYHTLGGFVFGQLGRAPAPGDDVSYDGMRFDVLEVEGNRIERVSVTFESRRRAQRDDEDEDEDEDVTIGG